MREAANAGIADIEAGPFRTFDSAATLESGSDTMPIRPGALGSIPRRRVGSVARMFPILVKRCPSPTVRCKFGEAIKGTQPMLTKYRGPGPGA